MNTVVILKSESLVESIFKDVVTFSFLLLCIWFSNNQGGGWWTFFTCAMFILWVAAAGARMTKTTIKTKAQAVSWANNLPEDAEAAHATK